MLFCGETSFGRTAPMKKWCGPSCLWKWCLRFLMLSSYTSCSRLATAFSVKDGQIYTADNQPYHLRGMSWFGFETPDFMLNGLWLHPISWYLDLLKAEGITTLRIPFSAELVLYHPNQYPDERFVSAEPEAQHKMCAEVLDLLFEKCQERNMTVMLDLHRLHKEFISELWYSPTDSAFTADDFVRVWETMLQRYGRHPNLIAIDLLNEPHGQATWGAGNPSTDWNHFAEGVIPILGNYVPSASYLLFVEGIEWGHTFRDYPRKPLSVPDEFQHRVVFSPHTYGRSVVPESSFDANILYSQWDSDFDFLRTQHSKTVVVGEWGGRTAIDQPWMQILVQYLQDRNMTDNFFWSLGPNSDDVQGFLLDDWTSVDTFKRGILKQM